MRFLEARAAAETGAVERAEHVLAEVTMPWVREGSRSVDDLWYRLEAARIARRRGVAVDDALLAEVRRTAALPYAYDFRMSAGPPVGGRAVGWSRSTADLALTIRLVPRRTRCPSWPTAT